VPDDNSTPLYAINFTIIGRVQSRGWKRQCVWCPESDVDGGKARDVACLGSNTVPCILCIFYCQCIHIFFERSSVLN
jgi:hypothetical protein